MRSLDTPVLSPVEGRLGKTALLSMNRPLQYRHARNPLAGIQVDGRGGWIPLETARMTENSTEGWVPWPNAPAPRRLGSRDERPGASIPILSHVLRGCRPVTNLLDIPRWRGLSYNCFAVVLVPVMEHLMRRQMLKTGSTYRAAKLWRGSFTHSLTHSLT